MGTVFGDDPFARLWWVLCIFVGYLLLLGLSNPWCLLEMNSFEIITTLLVLLMTLCAGAFVDTTSIQSYETLSLFLFIGTIVVIASYMFRALVGLYSAGGWRN